jgi:hypothetical protein
MKRRNKILAIAAAAAMLTGVFATTADAKRDQPPQPPDTINVWEYQGGTANNLSSDGPKSSNSYNLAYGSYVYRRGYWDVPLTTYNAGFNYRAGAVSTPNGSPRISIMLAMAPVPPAEFGVETGEVVYLDPYHCPSAFGGNGWATTNFFRSGSSCSIPTSFGTFTGHDAVPFVSAATSAWNEMAANTPNGETVASWGFLINDWDEPTTVVDRVIFGGNLLSKFAGDSDSFPDSTDNCDSVINEDQLNTDSDAFGNACDSDDDNDGDLDEADNCSLVANADQANVDGDGLGDACDTDLDVAGTYSATNDAYVFVAAIDQTASGATDGSAGTTLVENASQPDINGCYNLTGTMSFTFGSHTASGSVVGQHCPSGADYTVVYTVTITTWNAAASGGTVTFNGTQTLVGSTWTTTGGTISGTIGPLT